MTDMGKVARGYARRGWAVFPLWWVEDGRCGCGRSDCKSQGKHPNGQLVLRGVHDATVDLMTISQWWALCPDANIGIATGEPSQIIVLDVDEDAGGYTSFDRLEDRHGALASTWTVVTGGGGAHLYFKAPMMDVRSSAGLLGPGLDVRGAGGYVVAPPSLHASGTHYRWDKEGGHPNQCEMQDVPPWLLDRMTGGSQRYAEAAVVTGPITEGSRDVTLTSFAGSMRRRGMAEASIVAALRVENASRCQPPLPDKDIRRIAWSISRDAYAPPATATVRVAS